jgi:hypothetical protein
MQANLKEEVSLGAIEPVLIDSDFVKVFELKLNLKIFEKYSDKNLFINNIIIDICLQNV